MMLESVFLFSVERFLHHFYLGLCSVEEEKEEEDIISCKAGYNVDNYAEFLAAELMNRLGPYISDSDINYV